MTYKRGEFEVQKVGYIFNQMGYVLLEAPLRYRKYTIVQKDDDAIQVISAEDGNRYSSNIIMDLEDVLNVLFAADDVNGRAEAAEALA